MTADSGMAGLIQVGGIALAPLCAGFVQKLKARLQGRNGPSALQPYRELRRLWRKSGSLPAEAGPIYRNAPAVVVAGLVPIFLLVPIAGASGAWGLGNDALVVVGLLALARFSITAAAWDTGNAFATLCASRDLMIAVFADVVLLLVLVLKAISAGGTDILAISNVTTASVWSQPATWCAAFAFVLVALTEAGRQPVDNPDTHLELTMIHEGPLLEYSGRDLAALQWAGWARLWLMGILAGALFLPSGGGYAVRMAELGALIVVLCAGLALTETALAKMRVLHVPRLLGGGIVLCLIGLASQFIGNFS